MREVLSRIGPQEVFQDDKDVHRAIGAVFHTIAQHVTKGEIDQVRMSLKKSLRQLWPERSERAVFANRTEAGKQLADQVAQAIFAQPDRAGPSTRRGASCRRDSQSFSGTA